MKIERKKNAKSVSTSKTTPQVQAQIESRAYDLWLADGCRDGNDLSHWFQAEREVWAICQRPSAD